VLATVTAANWLRVKYQAPLTLLPPQEGGGQAVLPWPAPAWRAVIPARHHQNHSGALFTVLGLRPG
jgi:hypothetical protein